MAQTVGFWIVAVGSVASALLLVMSRNPVRCALYLIVNFTCLAILYLMLEAQLLAALQILVYAGAIMVLFLFVIMLLNLGGEQIQHDPLVSQRPLGVLFGALLLGFLGHALSQASLGSMPPSAAESSGGAPVDPVYQLGQLLMTKYVYPFEVTSLLLLVGIIGTVLLAKRRVGEAPNLRESAQRQVILQSAEQPETPVGAGH